DNGLVAWQRVAGYWRESGTLNALGALPGMALAEARMDAVFAAPRKPIPARQTQNSAEPALYAVAVAGAGQSPALRGARGSSPAYQNPLTSA
ncbi:hypothetical protein RZA67_05515, partial [Stenotrophomonas sp. C3(2023)]|nr:hypothetical protein [Stenotrophomonas sp. C3(2023)]